MLAELSYGYTAPEAAQKAWRKAHNNVDRLLTRRYLQHPYSVVVLMGDEPGISAIYGIDVSEIVLNIDNAGHLDYPLPVRRAINRHKLQAADLLGIDSKAIAADAIWLGITNPMLIAIQKAAADYWQLPAWQDDTIDEEICLTKYEIYWKQTAYLLEMMRYYRQTAVEKNCAGFAVIPLIRFNTND